MKYASDFRYIARMALRGRWPVAVLTGLVASLIGGELVGGGSFSSTDSENVQELGGFLNHEVVQILTVIAAIMGAFALLYIIVMFVIGGAAKLGYARFNLNLVDGRQAEFTDLFSRFSRLGEGFIMNLLVGIFTFLWSLLFVIPGLIKSYSYSMTPYILSEDPRITPMDAITESRRIMDGNKFRLFCLHFSFIGWDLLCAVPAIFSASALLIGTRGLIFIPLVLVSIVGSMILRAYKEAANAAFYREISGYYRQI